MINDVPLFKQKKNSRDCGIVGICMILNYYGKHETISGLRSKIKVDEAGTYAPQLGIHLINEGFKVEITNLNPRLFTRKDIGKNSYELMEHFKEMLKLKFSTRDKKVIYYFIDFIKSGGIVKPKIPDKEDIINEINNKRPLAALITSNFLLGSKPSLNSHFNVITGMDEDFIYVNDPLPDNRGGKHKYPINDFLFGLYASSNGDFDNGSLIKVRKI